MDANRIPEHMRLGLLDYTLYGVPPGDFLRAVLESDLVGAASRADSQNLPVLADYAFFLYNYLPADAWGNAEKVDAWMLRQREEETRTKLQRWPEGWPRYGDKGQLV